MTNNYSEVVETARQYYNSEDADNFYYHVWGGEDIHIGLYEHDSEEIATASRRTVEKMAGMLQLNKEATVIDLGSGYGGSARYLASHTGCHVDCLNLSEAENQRNHDICVEQGLADSINIIDGSFESIPAENNSYDVVWSQDAILHSGHRQQVIIEAARVLKPGGRLIFTDPMQADDCPDGVLQPVLDRIHLDTLGSFAFYREATATAGLEEVKVHDLTPQLTRHYTRVREELESQRDDLQGKVSDEYIDRMLAGLGHWISAGEKGYLAWGILEFRKPSLI